ncbi:MAG TPA: DUF2093 domain-containing protein [Caulobacteraceae bacterium]|jgi:hypothetical protein
MNVHDKGLGRADQPALISYGPGEYVVVRPGAFVICAVSGKRIPLEALRYWNPITQEAFAGPAEALARWREQNG